MPRDRNFIKRDSDDSCSRDSSSLFACHSRASDKSIANKKRQRRNLKTCQRSRYSSRFFLDVCVGLQIIQSPDRSSCWPLAVLRSVTVATGLLPLPSDIASVVSTVLFTFLSLPLSEQTYLYTLKGNLWSPTSSGCACCHVVRSKIYCDQRAVSTHVDDCHRTWDVKE